MTPKEIWQAVLGQLQLQVTPADYDTWIRDTQVISSEDGLFVVGTPNVFAREWLENRLHTLIKKTLTGLVGRTTQVRFVVQTTPAARERYTLVSPVPETTEEPGQPSTSMSDNRPPARAPLATGLRPTYTFDSFIVGPSNRLAHAAAQAVVTQPAGAYNPLFLYGGVGLGKTHLLHAIGHEAQRNQYHVLYVSSETFTNDFIDAIQQGQGDEFRNKYRFTDILLIDDIQFVIGKERTQEEFFHTFNALHSAGKQIVLTADRPPKAFRSLESRLQSRFEWGLVADIQPPDLETRIAILRAKAEHRHYQVPATVLDRIARKAQNNIRELEGALTRVVAYANALRRPLDIDTAEEALADLVRHPKVTQEQVVQTVAEHFGLTPDELISRSRRQEIAQPRQIAMYLLREETNTSFAQIGQELGGRDHSTVHHGYEKITKVIQENEETRRAVMQIREKLFSK
ncbi:MAG: chromosomal replication initiator protein DnaA [Chloroflexi bacterium]|nr:chromosomal replication initiator protein DnaA [Chloroflexota bacterium]MBU1751774.1 chromosomal replication initiator protein DnaA [Chloroflexota bacterium]MBU1879825.1 chromosomal replication initiator protein DnaA [Chloroflexota bacterium]